MSNFINRGRLGVIEIPLGLINNRPDEVQLVLGQMFVTRTQKHTEYDAIQFIGYSDHFDVLRSGEEYIPEYKADLSRDRDGTFRFNGFVKLGPSMVLF